MLSLSKQGKKEQDYEQSCFNVIYYFSFRYPIFDGVSERKLRAFMALLLGCDVYCEGMKGIGAGRLSNLINVELPDFFEKIHQPNTNEPITLYGFLHCHLVRNTPGFDTSIVQTYI